MSVITTRIYVAEDGALSGVAPRGQIPPGEHQVTISIIPAPMRRMSVRDMPVRDTPWNEGVSLRREDMYGNDGR